jgi:predicted dehydrogenase
LPGLAEKVGSDYGVERTYASWQEMLEHERPDVVSVCVPNMFHHEVALGALRAGAHVLCEKPLAPSVAESEEMFEAAHAAGKTLMVAQNLRFRHANEAIKTRIDAGDFGPIYHADAVYVRRLGIPTWGSFTRKSFSAGGALLDIGVHVLDLALWFMGGPEPVEVSAQVSAHFGKRSEYAAARNNGWDPAKFDVDDFAAAFIRFQSGATLNLQASWASHIERDTEYVRVLGLDAGAITDPPTIYSLRGGQKVDEALDIPRMPGWEETVAHFLAVVDGAATPRVRPEEAIRVQRILAAAYESAALGRAVSLNA